MIGRSLASNVGMQLSFVASSDLSRASETAAIIADELGVTDVLCDIRLREADAGPWEGMTPLEITERWPGFLEAHRRPAGFETTDSVVARARQACVAILHRIARDEQRSAVAVTHSGFIRSLCRHLGAVDQPVPNLGGVWIRFSDDDLHLGPLFAIDGDVVSGVDGPGEDPGEQAEERGDRSRAERGLAG